MPKSNSISSSMIFMTLERYSIMFFQMVLQIVVARILSPQHYGIVAMMSVFISLANVFINDGFNRAVVQKKNATDVDYSTAFTINLLIGVFLYLIIFFSAPAIAIFYDIAEIKQCIRALALILIFGSVNCIQIAIANRMMAFGNLFKCNLVSSVAAGLTGLTCALLGFGVWALIIQQLCNAVMLTLMLFGSIKWRPRLMIDRKSAKEMFGFGWKMLAAALINEIFIELNSLIIGKKYTSEDLAFYSKGKQFPSMIVSGLTTSISSVMLAAFSKVQSDKEGLHALIKKSINVNSYLVFPILGVFAMTAKPIITVLLTEKWLPCLPYVYLICFTFSLYPVASVQVQSIAAVGRSDMRLKMEFIKKGIALALLLPAIKYGPYAIAVSAAITSVLSVFVGSVGCQICTQYKLSSTLKDIIPIFLITIASLVPLYFIGKLGLPNIIMIIVEVLVGGALYVFLSYCFKFYGFLYVRSFVANKLKTIKEKHKKQ